MPLFQDSSTHHDIFWESLPLQTLQPAGSRRCRGGTLHLRLVRPIMQWDDENDDLEEIWEIDGVDRADNPAVGDRAPEQLQAELAELRANIKALGVGLVSTLHILCFYLICGGIQGPHECSDEILTCIQLV